MEDTMNTMTIAAALLLGGAVATASSQQPAVTVNGDDITLTGCVTPAAQTTASPEALVWTRGQMMLAGAGAAAGAAAGTAPNAIGTRGISGRVFYWLDDEEDLRKHVGKRVEVKGTLEDFEEGEIEVERDGDFTEIEIDIDGRKEEARVPTSWLGTAAPEETTFKIVARQVDVKEIKVLGACGR
jgi:hypothetical protein